MHEVAPQIPQLREPMLRLPVNQINLLRLSIHGFRPYQVCY
jgi:hypothetical protein